MTSPRAGIAARIAALVVVAGAISGLVAAVHPRPPRLDLPRGVAPLTWAEAERWGGAVMWVDARASGAFERGHVAGAISVELGSWDDGFDRFVHAWTPDRRVVVYCDGGGCAASREVAERLAADAALERIWYVEDGWKP